MVYERWTGGEAGPDDLDRKSQSSEDVRELCPVDLLFPLCVAKFWGFQEGRESEWAGVVGEVSEVNVCRSGVIDCKVVVCSVPSFSE